jgi:two-component sensor histidine kinase
MWFTWFWSALPVWMLLIASASFSNVLFRLLERQVDDRIGLLSERKRAEEAEKLSAQRTHLMREMSHRVKNNLTLVASMINLQSRKHGLIDGPTISARIQAIAQVHELLYDSASGMDVSFGTTLKKLSASDAVIPPERGIRVECFIDEDVTLTPDVSTVLSIAVAELLTNSVKHAFPGEDGSLSLRLGRDGNKVVLDVWDDGTGLPEAQERSSGLTLVDALIAQAGGSIERLPPPGARFRIRFPAPGST